MPFFQPPAAAPPPPEVTQSELDAEAAARAAFDASTAPPTKRVTMALASPSATPGPAAATSGWVERHLVRLPVATTRWRMRFANRDVKNEVAGTAAMTVAGVARGVPSLPSSLRWTGGYSAAPSQVLAGGAVPTNGTDLVTPWVTDPAQQFGPDHSVVSWILTAPAGGTYASMVRKGGFRRVDAGAAATFLSASNSGYTNDYSLLDVRLEYEFAGTNQVGLYVGASNDEGYPEGDSNGYMCTSYESWPGALGLRRGIPWVNASIAGAREAPFSTPTRTAFTRFDLATTVPDFAVVNLAGNSILGSWPATSISADVAWVITNSLRPMGIKRIYLCTLQPLGVGAADAKDIERQAYNAWVRTVPLGVAGVIDMDLILRDPANVRNVRPEFVLADLIHLRRSGLQYTADQVGVGPLR